MSIKQIFDEIASESGSNRKMEILESHKDNPVLKQVLYLANSRRVKFYIKQIPKYVPCTENPASLESALPALSVLSQRIVTGNDAIQHLTEILSDLTAEDAYIIERIIDKDCKIGMGTTNINKIFPDLIEETPYMGARAFSREAVLKILDKGKALSQIKMDGRYCNAVIRRGIVDLESRQGETNHLTGATFLSELTGFPDCVLNGELTMDGIHRYISNGIIGSLITIIGKVEDDKDVSKETENFYAENGMTVSEALKRIRYTVWDTISIEEYGSKGSNEPYYRRLQKVSEYITASSSTMVSLVEVVEVTTYPEAMSHFQKLINAGHEGTILKAYDGPWKDGKPNHQIKLKLEIDLDLKIVGFNYGTGKNEKLISSVTCESSDGKLRTSPTGIKEKTMHWITENQEALMGKILKVKCSGISQDSLNNYSLLHPVYKEIRDDKEVADSLETILDIEAMAKGLK